jgi:hypothetical protein
MSYNTILVIMFDGKDMYVVCIYRTRRKELIYGNFIILPYIFFYINCRKFLIFLLLQSALYSGTSFKF